MDGDSRWTELEYLGGPLDGERAKTRVGAGNIPGHTRIVTTPARYSSALDQVPSVPAQDHRYRRQGERPGAAGTWTYVWAGQL